MIAKLQRGTRGAPTTQQLYIVVVRSIFEPATVRIA